MKHFSPAWWLPSPHLQTLWPALAGGKLRLPYAYEQFELPDEDFLDLVWVGQGKGPIVLVLHGLGGSLRSPYATRVLRAIYKQGWCGVLMHFRGCSGRPNRLPRSYHSGETGDLQTVVTALRQREPNTPILAVGYSLGGNVLLKWLGESGEKDLLTASVAVSVPFELKRSVESLSKGFSKLYQWHLIRALVRAHQQKFKKIPAPISFSNINRLKNFLEFDNAITAPLHGFKNAEEYYAQSSSRQYLDKIQVPTLILHAEDDPFTTLSSIPSPQEVSAHVTLEVLEKGGHVGFVMGKFPWRPIYWLEQRIMHYFNEII